MFNLPEPLDVVIFEKNSSWTLPNKARMVYFWGCSAGGGGGGGCSGPQDTQRGGGAGGSPGNIHWGFMPSVMFPDNIYIFIPGGGAGGGPDQSGTSGSEIYVSRESLGAGGVGQYTVVSAGAGLAGSAGTTTAGGTALATGSTVQTLGLDFSDANLITGATGGSGSATGTAGSYNQVGGVQLGAGTGGAGCAATYVAASGGGIFYNSEPQTSRSGGIGNATQGGNGVDGLTQWLEHYPFVSMIRSCGGTGGGNSNTGTGGNGGNGGYGSGGGGGGAGLTGGRGGNGGPGLLIIAYW